jgi:mutator protein MutT
VKSIPIALALVWRGPLVLIAKRRKGAHLGGFWEFPGGRIEDGECAEQAAVREVCEETGIVCAALKARDTFEFEYPDRRIVFHPVDCTWVSGEPQPLGSLEPRWVSVTEIASYEFPPANAKLIAELAQHG